MKKNQDIFSLSREDAFASVRKANGFDPGKLIDVIKTSNLRGRGGAGFPVGLKWEAVFRESSFPKYVVINIHEGEPYTLKDEFILESFPHLMLAGAIIAANVVSAKEIHIVINKKYKSGYQAVMKEINLFAKEGLLDGIMVIVHHAENRYIGGEETSLLNELEDKRIEPRKKIPFVCSQGLYGKPTIVNNAESFSNIPFIINNGSAAFRKFGTKESAGTKIITVAGDVKKPGIIEIELGETLKEVIKKAGGEKGKTKFILTGGYSGSIVLPKSFNLPFAYESFSKGVVLGAGTVIVYNNQTNLYDLVLDIAKFYKTESCGQCTPCREGTTRVWEIISRSDGKIKKEDKEKIDELFGAMNSSSFCPLGQFATMAISGIFYNFRKEIINGR